MRKTIKKYLVSILGALSALCIVFGGVFSAQGKGAVEAAAEIVAEKQNITLAEGATQAITDTPVVMDGLTVTISSSVSLSDSRFGVAFTAENGTAPLLNLIVSVKSGWGQHRLYVYKGTDIGNHNDTNISINTIAYTDPNASSGPTNGINTGAGLFDCCLVSAPTSGAQYTYSFKFNYEGKHSSGAYSYWSLEMTVLEGSPFGGTEWTTTMAYLLHDTALGGQMETLTGADATGAVGITAYNYATSAVSGTGAFDNTTFSVTVDERPDVQKYIDEYERLKAAGTDGAATAAARETALEAIAALDEADKAEYQTQLETIDKTETRWTPREGTSIAATYNMESGYTELKPTAYGRGYTYNELVALDGLTVTFGSNNHYQNGRYGFGLASAMGEWTLDSEHGGTETVNFVMLPKFTTHTTLGKELDGLFVCDTHETHTESPRGTTINTILYTDESCTRVGVCSVDGVTVNYLPSYETDNTTYKITFNKCTNGNWKVTIQLVEGWAYQVATAVAYLKAEELNFLTAEGKCFITAWAAADMPQANPFFVEITESDSGYLKTIEVAEVYETAIRQGVDDVSAYKTAYKDTMSGLNVYEYIRAQNLQEELETLATVMEGFTQEASVTVNDSLTLNYKLTIPNEVMADFGGLAVTVIVNSGEENVGVENYTYNEANFTLVDGKYVLPIGKFGPQWMTATVQLDCVALDKLGELLFERHVENYSLKTYCEAVLASNPSEILKTVIVDMLNYGTAAQNYTGRNMDALANSGINQTGASSWTDTTADGIANALSGQNSATVRFTSISALLEDKVTLIAKFTSEKTLSELAASIQVGDSYTDVAITDLGNGKYMLESPALTPLQFDDVYTFWAWSNDDAVGAEATCAFSVNSYVKRNYGHEKAGDLVKALYLYGESVKLYAETLPTNRLADVGFENGFLNLGTNSQNQTSDNMTTVNTSATPSWKLAQWGSTVNLANGTKTENNGVYVFADAAKSVTVDTVNDTLALEHKGSVEYNTGVANGWPHLLLQQDFSGDGLVRIADQKSLVMQMDYTVTACTATDSTSSTAAQFVWYVTLQNRNKDSADYGQYMWFGILLYDNRNEGREIADYNQVDSGKADATGVMIYQPGTERWNPDTKTSPTVGQNVSLNFDILVTAEEAFNKIKQFYRDNASTYFQNTTWEDLYIGSTNFGFEVSGSYDIGVKISNLGLIASRNLNVLPAQNVQ